MIVAIPVSAIIGGAVLLSLSIVSFDGLVADDYYRQGLGINRQIERTQRAEELGIQAKVNLNNDAGLLEINLVSSISYTPPEEIIVFLRHATRAGFDQEIRARAVSHETYHAYLPKMLLGKWHVELTAEDWRISETLIL